MPRWYKRLAAKVDKTILPDLRQIDEARMPAGWPDAVMQEPAKSYAQQYAGQRVSVPSASPAIEPPALGEGGVTKNSGRPTARATSTGGDHDDEGKPVVQPSAGEPRAADLVQ